MSRPAANSPTPKQNMLQTVLLMVTIFLGFQLFMSPQRNSNAEYSDSKGIKKELQTRADVYAAMLDAAALRKDQTLENTLLKAYENKIDEDEKKKVITHAQAQSELYHGLVLTSDALLRAGIHKNESSRIRQGYNLIEKYQRQHATDPAWNASFSVPVDPAYGWSAWTGPDLYKKIVSTLSERNKVDLIWGFIPGGYQLMDTLVGVTGKNPNYSYALAGLFLAIVVRSIVFPLAQKQIMSARQMSQLTPRIKEIKDKYKDDQVEQNAKVMDLYKEYGINPFQGCGPAFIQMPLFLTVYQCMLHYQFEFVHGYFLWINPATSDATHGFIGHDLGQNDYILVIIYGITMCITTLLTPVTDPTQVKQQRLMGLGMSLIFTFMMFTGMFPIVSGFVLYWIFTNMLATAQSLRAYRLPLPPLVKVNAPGGGVYPNAPTGRWANMMDQARKMAEDQQKGQPKDKAKELPKKSDNKKNDDPEDGGTGTPARFKPKKRK